MGACVHGGQGRSEFQRSRSFWTVVSHGLGQTSPSEFLTFVKHLLQIRRGACCWQLDSEKHRPQERRVM